MKHAKLKSNLVHFFSQRRNFLTDWSTDFRMSEDNGIFWQKNITWDAEFHGAERSGVFISGNSSKFQNILVNTDQTNHVSATAVSQLFDVSSHHKKGSLNLLDVQISLLSELVVGSVNKHLKILHDFEHYFEIQQSYSLTSADCSGVLSSEGNESSFFRGGNHLWDVHSKLGVLVAFSNGVAERVVFFSAVEDSTPICLSKIGEMQEVDNHIQQSVSGGDPLSHDDLQKRFRDQVLLVVGKVQSQSVDDGPVDVRLVVHGDISSHTILKNLRKWKARMIMKGGVCIPFGIEIR